LSAFLDDLRYTLRALAKSPGFAAAAIATLALGIGGNCAMFGVVNAIFLKPLPFPEPQRLVRLLDKTTTPSGQTYTGNLRPRGSSGSQRRPASSTAQLLNAWSG